MMSGFRCLQCGKPMKAETATSYRYTACGLSNIVLSGVTVYKCACGEHEVTVPAVEQLHEVIAADLARKQQKLAPDEIRFLRVHLGFSGEDFAKAISVNHATVSRWENGKQPMSEPIEKILRLMILSKTGPFRDYDELEKLASKPAQVPRDRKFVVCDDEWRSKKVA